MVLGVDWDEAQLLVMCGLGVDWDEAQLLVMSGPGSGLV